MLTTIPPTPHRPAAIHTPAGDCHRPASALHGRSSERSSAPGCQGDTQGGPRCPASASPAASSPSQPLRPAALLEGGPIVARVPQGRSREPPGRHPRPQCACPSACITPHARGAVQSPGALANARARARALHKGRFASLGCPLTAAQRLASGACPGPWPRGPQPRPPNSGNRRPSPPIPPVPSPAPARRRPHPPVPPGSSDGTFGFAWVASPCQEAARARKQGSGEERAGRHPPGRLPPLEAGATRPGPGPGPAAAGVVPCGAVGPEGRGRVHAETWGGCWTGRKPQRERRRGARPGRKSSTGARRAHKADLPWPLPSLQSTLDSRPVVRMAERSKALRSVPPSSTGRSAKDLQLSPDARANGAQRGQATTTQPPLIGAESPEEPDSGPPRASAASHVGTRRASRTQEPSSSHILTPSPAVLPLGHFHCPGLLRSKPSPMWLGFWSWRRLGDLSLPTLPALGPRCPPLRSPHRAAAQRQRERSRWWPCAPPPPAGPHARRPPTVSKLWLHCL
uniref:basic proline-rich protein-like n=1 Tax=Jaculus jaculus TaxID=51337 RepID=UPI001E1B37CE|nr:basic proline-rich protein-like [Jaculus jaculus]